MPVYKNYSGEIAARLDEYRVAGQKEAAAHRPPSDSLRSDQHEASLQSEAEKWLADEQRLFDSVLTEASKALADVHQKMGDLKNQTEQLLSDTSLVGTINSEMAEDRNPLVVATANRMRAEVDLKHLRAKNHIVNQAVYPDSKILHYGIIAVLALIETVINAFFYENSQGLLGGFVVASSVAAVNMSFALLLGSGFRWKNLKSIDSKVFGWSCFATFVILAIYCNALFAAFRSEYQILVDPTDPQQIRQGFAVAMGEAKLIFVGKMQIADLSSFVLFGIGLLMSLFAFHKGYTIDDRYPDHGKLDRLVKELYQKETALQEVLRQRVKNFLHHRRADAQAMLGEPAVLSGLAARRIADLSSGSTLLKNQTGAIQRDFSLVLNAYRAANTAIRATDPPEYFKHVPDLTMRTDSTGAEQYIAQLRDVQESIQNHRDKYQAALNAKLQTLQADSAIALKDTFNAFLHDVDTEAQESINRSVTVIHRAIPSQA